MTNVVEILDRIERIAAGAPTDDDLHWIALCCKGLLRNPDNVRHIEQFVGIQRGRGQKTVATLIRERRQSDAVLSYYSAIGEIEMVGQEAALQRELEKYADEAARGHKPKDAKERALEQLLIVYDCKPPKSGATFSRAKRRAIQMVDVHSLRETVETSPHEL
ncbi:MAG: hypothetical protein HY749_15860 [Gammaproteobacteria bacterium]|nr:hypothetical protein [Gammaproteobacteria bacterium]